MRTFLRILMITILVPAATALAQDQPPAAAASQENVLSAHGRMIYGVTGRIVLRSAEDMPEERYGFRPAESVRSFGQIVGHVADSQYGFCSVVLGEKNPAPKVEKTVSSKAGLLAALKDAFAYCDRAYEAMTDASATQQVKLMGMDMPKLGVLSVSTSHTMEHYGNLVTYLRMNDIVPPTSQPEFMRQVAK